MTYPPPSYPSAPPPGGGYGPPPNAIPGQVTAAAVLVFISAAFTLLAGLLLLFVGTIAAIAAVLGVVFIVIGAVEIWVGIALRQLKPWARTTTMVLAGIGIVVSILSLIRGGGTSVVGLVVDVVIIYLLMRPESQRAFATAGS